MPQTNFDQPQLTLLEETPIMLDHALIPLKKLLNGLNPEFFKNLEFEYTLTTLLKQLDSESHLAINNSLTKPPEHKQELVNTINIGIATFTKLLYMLTAINTREPDVIHKLPQQLRKSFQYYPEESTEILSTRLKHPELPTTNLLIATEFLVRGIFNQWQQGLTDATCQTWLKDFYQHLLTKIGNHEELATNYTDHERLITVITNTIAQLLKEKAIPTNPRVLLVGPATGTDVEQPIFEQLNSQLQPSEIIGIDPVAYPDSWNGMQLIQTDLVTYTEEHPDEQFDLIISLGSGLNNMESFHRWLKYMQAFRQLSTDQSVLIYETGNIDINPKNNLRTREAKAMNNLNPSMLWGMYGIINAYRTESDQPNDYGASLFPQHIYSTLLKLAGFSWLTKPFKTPTSNSTQEENFALDPIPQNPLNQPFWKAGSEDIRMIMVAQQQPQKDSTLLDALELISRNFAVPQKKKK